MAYTIVSQVSLSSNDFAHRFMVPVHGQKSSDHVSFLGKGKLSLKETNNNTNTVRTRVTKSNVVRSEATPFRKPVTPRTLEDPLRPPTNLYTAEAPHTATFRSVEKIAVDPIGGDIYHIVFDHGGFVPHWEGQVFGVVRPGENPYDPVPGAKATLFFGASSRYGDFFDGKTASLCVRRMEEGSISDFLCTAKPGDKLQITGPSREATIKGDFNNPNGVHIMIATGTGVSTYRASLRRMFAEDIPKFKFSGLAWLLAGHRTAADQLYKAEFEKYKEVYPHNFQYDVVLSRERKNNVQDFVKSNAEQIFDLLLNGAFIYFARLEGMVKLVEDALAAVAASRGLDWAMLLDSYKRNDKWRVHVY